MFSQKPAFVFITLICLGLAGCLYPDRPDYEEDPSPPYDDGSLRIAAIEYSLGDLSDPQELAKYVRADLVVLQCDQLWGRPEYEGRLATLRAAKPDIKIIGYFRSKVVKVNWVDETYHTYNHDLYQASLPYWCSTTTGDTLMDWPGAVLFDYTNPEARQAMLDVFLHYQQTSSNKVDGVYWDYFNDKLWIAPTVTGMEGEPDMDGDGVGHFEDDDEQQAFMDAQYSWVWEMRAALGSSFLQIANGSRALTDSLFAGQFDGMFYEVFPNVGFSSGETFRRSMSLDQYNNLWTAHSWPRTINGGPWLILSHAQPVGSIRDENGQWVTIDPGDLLRAVALLTGATSTHYIGNGQHSAGMPDVELNLGPPLGPVSIEGDRYSRQFLRGSVILEMGVGQYPQPFAYAIPQDGVIVDQFGEIVVDP